MTQSVIKRPKVSNVDRLHSIGIVENMIKKAQRFMSEEEFYNSLPPYISHSHFKGILRYLQMRNKIIYDKDGSIVWTFIGSRQARRSLEESVPLF
jgi:hypothetical protein